MRMFWEELKKIFRLFLADPKALAAGLIAPTMILIVFSIIFGNFASFPIAVINRDTGNYGALLKREIFEQISPLGNKPYFESVELNESQASNAFRKNDILGYLIIPQDFTRSIEEKNYPAIEFAFNNYNSDFAKNLRLYLQEGILSFYRACCPEMAVRVDEILPTNGQVEWVEVIATGAVLLAAVIGAMFFYLYFFFKEKEYGTLSFYRLSPLSPVMSFTARVFSAWLFGMVTAMFNMIFVYLIVGDNFFQYWKVFLPVLSLSALAYIGMSAIVSLIVDKFFSAAIAAMFGCILVWFMSGGINEVPEGMINFNTVVAHIFPNLYALKIIRADIFHLEMGSLSVNYLVLAGLSLFMLTTAFVMFYRRIGHKSGN